MLISSVVRDLRHARGWSREELASRAGISRWHLWSVESRKYEITLYTLERISDALEVKLGHFFRPERLLLEHPFVRAIAPMVRHLNQTQRQHALKILQAAPRRTR